MLPGPANEGYAAFVRQKIRERVTDPVVANIPGKARFLLTSPASAPVMRAKRAEVVARGYARFLLQ